MQKSGSAAAGKPTGHLHPITILLREIITELSALGFEVVEGPERETEYYNFDVLNIPKDHPARDMQDTFWLQSNQKEQLTINKGQLTGSRTSNVGGQKYLLRTHTSAVQARYMEEHLPPFAIAVPGRVFRREATDATHEVQFYQIEGLVVGENVTLAHLRGTLETFFKKLFGKESHIRFRPSFFPFVEPGVEIDASCFKCKGTGCNLCKQTGWVEVMGAGMVHPNVLGSVGIDPRKWRGFAFGGGVDRLAMLKYGIDDVRLLYAGDLRLVTQF